MMTEPSVTKLKLKKEYEFNYENFVVSTQHDLYLLLEKQGDIINCLKFNFSVFKYGYPNDEVGHPLMKYGLGFYGMFEVENSEWIAELRQNNRSHSRDSDSLHVGKRHFVAKFKDVTLEVIAREYQEVKISSSELFEIINSQLKYLELE